ncbi:MAG: phosphatidate cytidylyltransferase [Bacteroidetes bacterium]|nr:phosphatidate cytidylyltransferase [Bacteroidota bacterium]
MALNLKTLGIRSLSAIVFVTILISSMLYNYITLTGFFFIISLIGLSEYNKLIENLGQKPFKALGYFLSIFLFLAFINWDLIFNFQFNNTILFYTCILCVVLIFIQTILSKNKHPFLDACVTLFGVLYVVVPFALIGKLSISFTEFESQNAWNVLGIIFLIWSNDTFAYLGGSLFGKHKLIERVSPGKTWEGTIFGIVITVVISFLIKTYLLQSNNTILWLTLGVVVPITATFGDLFESLLKRKAGVKDSGKLMPGHGGVLDRFDSLLFVVPVSYVIVKILS